MWRRCSVPVYRTHPQLVSDGTVIVGGVSTHTSSERLDSSSRGRV